MSAGSDLDTGLQVAETAVWRLRADSVKSELSTAERRVANYVLAHSREIVGQSVTEVAQHSKTSEATVVRFCRRLGYAGYQALKIAVAQEVVPVWQSLDDDVCPEDDIDAIKRKVFSRGIQALQETYSLVENERLTQAVTAICAARRLDIYGVGGSG